MVYQNGGVPLSTNLPKPTLDEKDLKIAASIIRDAKVPVARIAKESNIPESTVQKRLGALIDQGIVERVIRVKDWSAAGYPLRYMIEVEINQPELSIGQGGPHGEQRTIETQEKLAEYIKDALPQKFLGSVIVQDVTILLGREHADLTVTARARDHKAIRDFVTKGLRSLRGVHSTVTAQEAWSCIDGDL